MKIQKILKRLLQLHPKSVDLSLIRIKRLLKDLNNPEKKIANSLKEIKNEKIKKSLIQLLKAIKK